MLKFNIKVIVLSIILLLFTITVYAKNKDINVNLELINISKQIVDNNVQIKLINQYINNLNETSEKNKQQLDNEYKQLSIALGIFYKLNLNPKENLLVKNLNQNEIINTYIVINYWSNYAINKVKEAINTLNNIENNYKQLNIAKKQLQILNKNLVNNKIKLNSLIAKNNGALNPEIINTINKSREQFKYAIATNKSTDTLFNNINKPILKPKDKILDQNFVKQKGNLLLPITSGYLHSKYKSSNYYNINYFGIVLIGTQNSSIVAPYNGEVIFNEKLEKYNQLIIIKHSPSYVSIISGDFTSNVKITQLVKKGEVIGKIQNTTKPIYYELEYQNSPINPENWLKTKDN